MAAGKLRAHTQERTELYSSSGACTCQGDQDVDLVYCCNCSDGKDAQHPVMLYHPSSGASAVRHQVVTGVACAVHALSCCLVTAGDTAVIDAPTNANTLAFCLLLVRQQATVV